MDNFNKKSLYFYKIELVDIYDGDTITVNLDLGCHVWLRNIKIRLAGINAPEVRGKEKTKGLKSKQALIDIISKNKGDLIVKTLSDKPDKYGRLLGFVYKGDINVNLEMLKNGFADKYIK